MNGQTMGITREIPHLPCWHHSFMSEPDGITLEDLLTPEFVADLAYGVYVYYIRCSTRILLTRIFRWVNQLIYIGIPST